MGEGSLRSSLGRDTKTTDKTSLPQSFIQWKGQLEHLQGRSTNTVGKNGQAAVPERVYQTMQFLP